MARILAMCGLAASLLLAANAAQAALPEPQRHGPACTPAGCPGTPGASSVGTAAAFAGSAIGAGALARRRRPPHS